MDDVQGVTGVFKVKQFTLNTLKASKINGFGTCVQGVQGKTFYLDIF
jgi:hypothetical protein